MSNENLPLEEWKAALENARSFNTLLLQLRGFGIPVVITIMGGGVAFASKIDIPTIPVRYASIILALIALVLLLVMVAIYRAAKAGSGDTDLTGIEIMEGVILWLVPILGLVVSLTFHGTKSFGNAFAVSSPGVFGTLLFALTLLLGLYGIDRCYYYKLLIGAVKRARELESPLGFLLTNTIGNATPPNHSKNFITTMYWLPALGALMAVVILGYVKLWTGYNEAMSGDGLIKCLQDLLR